MLISGNGETFRNQSSLARRHTTSVTNVCLCDLPAPVSALGGIVVSWAGRPALHTILPATCARGPSHSCHTAAGGSVLQAADTHLQPIHGKYRIVSSPWTCGTVYGMKVLLYKHLKILMYFKTRPWFAGTTWQQSLSWQNSRCVCRDYANHYGQSLVPSLVTTRGHGVFSSIYTGHHLFGAQITWVFILLISFLCCCSLRLSSEMPVKEVQHCWGNM